MLFPSTVFFSSFSYFPPPRRCPSLALSPLAQYPPAWPARLSPALPCLRPGLACPAQPSPAQPFPAALPVAEPASSRTLVPDLCELQHQQLRSCPHSLALPRLFFTYIHTAGSSALHDTRRRPRPRPRPRPARLLAGDVSSRATTPGPLRNSFRGWFGVALVPTRHARSLGPPVALVVSQSTTIYLSA